MLHWSTCNANLQRRFATQVSRMNLQTCYTFESLSKTCNVLQHCKYRKKSSATGCYTGMIFRATSCRCKLALHVDQCNTTFRPRQNEDTLWQQHCVVRRVLRTRFVSATYVALRVNMGNMITPTVLSPHKVSSFCRTLAHCKTCPI